MSHLACVFIREGIDGNMVEMILITKHFLEVRILYCIFKEHVDEEKRITFGLLGLMVCVILFALYGQLHNKDNIPVKASAIHPEEDRIFYLLQSFHKESTLLSTSTGERFNRRTFKVADVPYIQTKSVASTDIVLLAEHEPFTIRWRRM